MLFDYIHIKIIFPKCYILCHLHINTYILAFPIEVNATDDEVMPEDPDNRLIFDFQYSF